MINEQNLQAKNERIEQLEIDLSESEKVYNSCLFLITFTPVNFPNLFTYRNLINSASFILLNKKRNWTSKVNLKIAR